MVVPSTKPADDILEEMRTTGHYFAVVIDEFGGTAGVLTLDDLIEALVGAMVPEVSPWPVLPERADATDEPDGSLVLDGLLRLEEFEDATGLKLTAEDHDLVETLGGLVMTRLGRIPSVGDELTLNGRILRVEEMDGLRVSRLRLLPPNSQAEDTQRAA
jgi:CBS domain containing-hemolysin-like protein